jgi:hypothetical protein
MACLIRPGSVARLTLILGGLLGLAACATPYQARSLTGGFSDTRLDANTFRVEFLGNAYTARERVETYLLRRAAEVTLENGYDYFVLLTAGTERNVAAVTMPGTYTATTTGSAYAIGSSAYGSAVTTGTYVPGATIPVSHYGASAIVKAFKGRKPSDLASAFNAREILHYAGIPVPTTVLPVGAPPTNAPEPPRSSAAPSPDSDTLSGTYAGAVTGEQSGQRLTMRMSFTIVQQGQEVTGTWTTSGGTSGTLRGVIAESRVLTFDVTQLTPCRGDFTGTAVVESRESTLIGSYSGRGCRGPVQASFSAVRQ